MSSLLPQYQSKISYMTALAPAVYLKHMQTFYAKYAHLVLPSLEWMSREVFPHSPHFKYLCQMGDLMGYLCLKFIYSIMGRDLMMIDPVGLPKILIYFIELLNNFFIVQNSCPF